MKVVIINKSDTTGGAAVVSYRLMLALRNAGVDARMLVEEKLSDSQYVDYLGPHWMLKASFYTERLGIFLHNGLNRKNLFKIDTADCGINPTHHPWVREADVVCLGWINQGLLSFKSIRLLASLNKPIVWTMHDMWCMTGICHHAGDCKRWKVGCSCGDCPLLGKFGGPKDMSHTTMLRKISLYTTLKKQLRFVGVSHWVADLSRQSASMADCIVDVIPNPFEIDKNIHHKERSDNQIRLLFGAARLDDPIKGLPILREALTLYSERYPDLARRTSLITFGEIRDASLLENLPVGTEHIGKVDPAKLPAIYSSSDIVVSTSHYETLPGTLVEGQAYGCIPVSFLHGGQGDIIYDGVTGFLCKYHYDPSQAASKFADAIAKAAAIIDNTQEAEIFRERMLRNVTEKFEASAVARQYIHIFTQMINHE